MIAPQPLRLSRLLISHHPKRDIALQDIPRSQNHSNLSQGQDLEGGAPPAWVEPGKDSFGLILGYAIIILGLILGYVIIIRLWWLYDYNDHEIHDDYDNYRNYDNFDDHNIPK